MAFQAFDWQASETEWFSEKGTVPSVPQPGNRPFLPFLPRFLGFSTFGMSRILRTQVVCILSRLLGNSTYLDTDDTDVSSRQAVLHRNQFGAAEAEALAMALEGAMCWDEAVAAWNRGSFHGGQSIYIYMFLNLGFKILQTRFAFICFSCLTILLK